MADISEVKLPDNSTYDIKDKTARSAINDAVTMTFATVATTGSYNDLSSKPTIPTITLNGSSTTSPSFYAPTSAGTSGQILTSNGSGAPTWGSAPASGPWEDGSGAYSAQIPDGGADASGDYSVAEGSATASGDFSHAEGGYAEDSPDYQSQEGAPEAAGWGSHAEGLGTYASGTGSHAEGGETQATGIISHAEGWASTAGGFGSHAEGYNSQAVGNYSHAEGWSTQTTNYGEHACGIYNKSTKTSNSTGNAGNTAFSIGIGTNNARSNAVEVMENGDIYVKGLGSYTGAYASSGISTLQSVIGDKQATLVSGTNIKTINNNSILGSGNITISGGVTDVRLSDGTSVVSSGIANLPIPSVSSTDNGKVFGVDSGVWSLITPSDELPSVSSTDNGKVLTVVNGAWAASTPAAAGVTGVGINEIRVITKAQYDALDPKVLTTLYIVTE